MKTPLPLLTMVLALAVTPALAHDEEALENAPPGEPYVQVSDVLPLPEFLSGLGTLFVNPDTLPAGPFLAYDHDGKLSATVYMTPLKALEDGTSYDDLGMNGIAHGQQRRHLLQCWPSGRGRAACSCGALS